MDQNFLNLRFVLPYFLEYEVCVGGVIPEKV